MPTRFVESGIVRRAFDALVPPDASPKQYLRWKELAAIVGLGEHWIRKRYQGRDRSELEVKSIERIRRALEARHQNKPDDHLKNLIQLLSAAEAHGTAVRFESRERPPSSELLRLRIVNVAFIRSNNANYCQRLEAGILFGMLDGMQTTHLINDETVDLSRAASPADHFGLIRELLGRFSTDPSFIERTYVVPLGTVAAIALSRALHRDATLRSRLGKELRVIFAGVTEPESTGILEFDRDYIGGMYAGNTFADRMQFISEAFPERPITFLYDPELPQDRIARNEVERHAGASVKFVKVDHAHPTRLPREARNSLVTGYTVINWRMHELTQDNPRVPFIGVNTSDLGHGAVLSTGNDDLRFGIECAHRLVVPDCRNEINLRDREIIRPAPVYGINQKACNLHGLVPRMAARNRCRVVVE